MSNLRDATRAVSRAKSNNLVSLVRAYNTPTFVDDLKAEGDSAKEIEKFFLFMVDRCLRIGVVLQRDGYLDLVRFAALNNLLKRYQKEERVK